MISLNKTTLKRFLIGCFIAFFSLLFATFMRAKLSNEPFDYSFSWFFCLLVVCGGLAFIFIVNNNNPAKK